MAFLLPPPPDVGFVPNPNLDLPIYLLTEVHPVRLEDGQVVMLRRQRPLSVIAGARMVLQCDPERLRRFVKIRYKNVLEIDFLDCIFTALYSY